VSEIDAEVIECQAVVMPVGSREGRTRTNERIVKAMLTPSPDKDPQTYADRRALFTAIL